MKREPRHDEQRREGDHVNHPPWGQRRPQQTCELLSVTRQALQSLYGGECGREGDISVSHARLSESLDEGSGSL